MNHSQIVNFIWSVADLIANPPDGKDWKRDQDAVRAGKPARRCQGRPGAGQGPGSRRIRFELSVGRRLSRG